MSWAKEINITESLEFLKKFQRQVTKPKLKLRLQFLIYVKENRFSRRDHLSAALGISDRCERNWAKQYREEGFNSFTTIRSGISTGSSLDVIHDELKEKVNDRNNPFKSYKDAVEWVKSSHRIITKYNTLRTYLKRRFKTKLKTPRKSHCKKDPQEVEDFKKKFLMSSLKV